MNPPKRSPAQILSIVFGLIMVLVSTPCVIGMVHDLVVGTDNLSGALIAGGFFTLLALVGIGLTIFGIRKPRAKPFTVTRSLERQVLGVAREHGGRLTTSELALYTEINLDECDAVLRHFEMRDVARSHVSDGGDIVYVFPHFDVDKQAAFDPTDDEVVFDRELAEEEQDEPQTADAHEPAEW